MDLDGKRILIVKPSSLGDVVHTLPVVHAIKRLHPGSHIGWIVQRTFQAILAPDSAVDEIIPIFIPSTSDPSASRGVFVQALKATVSTYRELRWRFRGNPYDLVLDLHASFRSSILGLANPNGIRVGFADAKELNTLFQNHRIQPDPKKPHAVDKNVKFAEFLNCPTVDEDYRIEASPEAAMGARDFLRRHGVTREGRVVYANPATRWESKHWTVAGWAQLADMLIDDARAKVVFAGGPGDVPYIERITDLMERSAIVAAGELSLGEAVALAEASDVYVGVDSGPMHIAAFAGTPVVALFGPTDPDKVGPYGRRSTVLKRDDLDCLVCRKRQCKEHTCMEKISAGEVFAAVCELVNW